MKKLIEKNNFRIFKLREAKEQDEYILYDDKRKTYNFYSKKRCLEWLEIEINRVFDLTAFYEEFLREKRISIKSYLRHQMQEETVIIDNIGYKPIEDLTFEEDNHIYFNIYNKSIYLKKECKEKEFSNIKKLILNLVNNEEKEYKYFIKWLAWQVQNPLRRLPTSIILQGEPGTGKTQFCNLVLKNIYGDNFTEINQSQINSEFNSYIMGKQLIVANEVIHNDNKFLVPDKLKSFVTDDYVSIRKMHKDPFNVRNYSQWIFVTNNEIPLKVDQNDRRYSIFKSKTLVNGWELIEDLKNNLESELEGFIYELKNIDVKYSEVCVPLFNNAKRELIKASFNSVESFYDFILNDLKGLNNLYTYCSYEVEVHSKDNENFIFGEEFYKVYSFYCDDNGLNKTNKIVFGRIMSKYGFTSETRRINGELKRVLIIK